MSSITLYLTDKGKPLPSNQFSVLINQLNTFFPNSTITTDSMQNVTVTSDSYNIYLGRGIPLKAIGLDNDRFFSITNNILYIKYGNWLAQDSIPYTTALSDAYFISDKSITNTFDILNLKSVESNVYPPEGVVSLYYKDRKLILSTPNDGLFYLNITPVLPPNSIIDDVNDFDEDINMPLNPKNPAQPSQTFITNTTPINFVVNDLVTVNSLSSGPFRIELYNNSPQFLYFVFSNGTLATLNESTCYAMEPGEKRIFILGAGFTSVSAVLGGDTDSGELRTTVEALSI